MRTRIGFAAAMCVVFSQTAAVAEKSGDRIPLELPRLFAGELSWPCWGDRQDLVVSLHSFHDLGGGLLRANGFEHYAVNGRFHAVEIELEVDLAAGRFRLAEIDAGRGAIETPFWDDAYEGSVDDGLRFMATTRHPHDEPCLPHLQLHAVGGPPQPAARALAGQRGAP